MGRKMRVMRWGAAAVVALLPLHSCQSASDDAGGDPLSEEAAASTGGVADDASSGGGGLRTGSGGSDAEASGGAGASSAVGGSGVTMGGGAGAPSDPSGGTSGVGGSPMSGIDSCEGQADGAYCGAELSGSGAPMNVVLCLGGIVVAESPCAYGCQTYSNTCFDPGGSSSIGSRAAVRLRESECRVCAEETTCGPEWDTCFGTQAKIPACGQTFGCMDLCTTTECMDACLPTGTKAIRDLQALDDCRWNGCFPECTKQHIAHVAFRHPPTCVACLENSCAGHDACLQDQGCTAVYDCVKACSTDGCVVSCEAAFLTPDSLSLWQAERACGDACSTQGCWDGQDLSGVP